MHVFDSMGNFWLRGQATAVGCPLHSASYNVFDLSLPQAFQAPVQRMRCLRPIDFARFRWVTCLREGHRLQMEALHGGWWGWVCRAV